MDIYGVIRSLSAEWCADTTKPVLGPMSIRGAMVKAFPSKRDDEDFLHLPDHVLYQILATVPAGLFTHVGPSLNRMRGQSAYITCPEDKPEDLPLWLHWSISHNMYVDNLVRWARYFLRDLERNPTKKWAPLSALIGLSFRDTYFGSIVKENCPPMYQRPLLNFTMHSEVSKAFLYRHVQEGWANDYMAFIRALDDGFEAFDGDYRKKVKVKALAQHILDTNNKFERKLYGNRSRPLPIHTDLDDSRLEI